MFFSTFEPISLTPDSCMRMVFPCCTSGLPPSFLEEGVPQKDLSRDAAEMRRKRVQESRRKGAETLKRRREAGAAKNNSQGW